MSLEDIEKELYGQKEHDAKRARFNEEKGESGENLSGSKETSGFKNPWRNEDSTRKNSEPVEKAERIGSKVFGTLAIVLVLLLGFTGFYLYQYFTTKDAKFSIAAPAEVKIGEVFTVTVIFQNTSKKTLYEPVISIQLPEGALYVDNTSKRVVEEAIPDSVPGDSIKRDYSIVFLGNPYQTYQLEGSISYAYKASTLSSKFQKKSSASIIARDSVLSVDMSMPGSIVNGEDFEMEVRYKNETQTTLRDAVIKLDMPENFSLNNSDPKIENGLVRVGELGSGEEGGIILSGFLTDDLSTFARFGAHALLIISGKEYEVASKNNSLSIAPSPLRVMLTSDKSGQTTVPGEEIRYSLQITNNSSISLREIVASVKFTGDYFDLSTVSGDGMLQDSDRTYVWRTARVPALGQIDPGQSIIIPFKISTKSGYALRGIQEKNSEISILATAVSPSVPPELTAKQTIGVYAYTLKMSGELDLQQSVFYAEPGSEIQNSGPMPPQIGSETTFTVHWKVRAQGSDMERVSIRAALGNGMQWTGKMVVKNSQQVPQYNAATQKLEWILDKVAVGAQERDPEAIFQLSLIPGSNTGGSRYVFLQDIVLSGKDAYTGADISDSLGVLDSRDIADANALFLNYDKIKP